MCRDGDFAGQQQIASKLHKLVGASDDYYIWWTIVAVTLQAKAAQKGAASALPAEKLFQLAEVMTAKQAQKRSLHTYEQLSLYLDILKVCTAQLSADILQAPPMLWALNFFGFYLPAYGLCQVAAVNAMTSALSQYALSRPDKCKQTMRRAHGGYIWAIYILHSKLHVCFHKIMHTELSPFVTLWECSRCLAQCTQQVHVHLMHAMHPRHQVNQRHQEPSTRQVHELLD